jgi:hypothetical protein
MSYERKFGGAGAAVGPPFRELALTRDAMRRLLMNGAGGAHENPTLARRPGARGPKSSQPKALRGPQVEETILKLLQSSPGLRTAAVAKATAAQRSTTDERLKRLQAKGRIERDGDSAGSRTPASRPRGSAICSRLVQQRVASAGSNRSWFTTSAA